MLGLLPYFNSAKGGDAKPMLADDRGLLVQQQAGRWYHLAKQGLVFSGSMAATGVVPPIYSSTSQVFGIWNPTGSGVNGILIGVRASYVDTTGATGGYCLAVSKNAGSGLATGNISAFTESVPERGLIGSGAGGNRIRFTASAATVVAPTIYRQLGINQTVLTAADTANGFFAFKEEFDGDVVLAPNTALWLCGNIATLAKLAASIVWAEVPV